MTRPVFIAPQSKNPRDFLGEERGVSLVEYCFLVAMIIGICLLAMRTLATTMSNDFNYVSDTLEDGVPPDP